MRYSLTSGNIQSHFYGTTYHLGEKQFVKMHFSKIVLSSVNEDGDCIIKVVFQWEMEEHLERMAMDSLWLNFSGNCSMQRVWTKTMLLFPFAEWNAERGIKGDLNLNITEKTVSLSYPEVNPDELITFLLFSVLQCLAHLLAPHMLTSMVSGHIVLFAWSNANFLSSVSQS